MIVQEGQSSCLPSAKLKLRTCANIAGTQTSKTNFPAQCSAWEPLHFPCHTLWTSTDRVQTQQTPILFPAHKPQYFCQYCTKGTEGAAIIPPGFGTFCSSGTAKHRARKIHIKSIKPAISHKEQIHPHLLCGGNKRAPPTQTGSLTQGWFNALMKAQTYRTASFQQEILTAQTLHTQLWGKALGERCFRSSKDLPRPPTTPACFSGSFPPPCLAKLSVPLLWVHMVRRDQLGHKLFISPGLLRSPLRAAWKSSYSKLNRKGLV